eukprot:GILK01008719.1.p1 GENE.GILK01008719.1~~GILK01008719.1.p1  ORF type:complete len:502 (-),score=77.64 GILK01008719.1:206-1711(-)
MFVHSALSVTNGAEKGRCVVATDNIKEGTVILRTPPLAACLQNQRFALNCHFCFKDAGDTSLQRCAKCKLVRYCSRDCQRIDWAQHKAECECITRISPRVPTSNIMLMGRLLHLLATSPSQVSGSSDLFAPSIANFNLLNSHRSDHTSSQLETLGSLSLLVCQYIGINAETGTSSKHGSWRPTDILELFCKFTANNFTVCDAEVRPVGIGIYPGAALFNHSCESNCVNMFEGRNQVVRTLRPILKGEELCVSYIELAAPTVVRKKELKESYFFDCRCNRCMDPQTRLQDQQLLSRRCRQPKCKGMIPYTTVEDVKEVTEVTDADLLCTGCQQVLTVQQRLTLEERFQTASDLRTKGRDLFKTGEDIDSAVQLLQEAEQIFESILSPLHVSLLNTRNDLLTVLIDAERWLEARDCCAATIPTFKPCYPANLPLLGLQYMMLGKLQWYLQQAASALDSFRSALSILEVSHGSNHPLVQDLSERLREADHELRYTSRGRMLEST